LGLQEKNRGIIIANLVRWKNVAMIFLCQISIFLFLNNESLFNIHQWILFGMVTLCTCLTASAGYIINDYQDVKIDQINKPLKVLINRKISARNALVLYFSFGLLAHFLAYLVSFHFFLMVAFITLWLWIYSIKFKSIIFIGNFSVAAMTGLALYIMIFPFHTIDLQWIFFYSFFAFLISLLREIIKDMEDVEGDKAMNCKTLPIVRGIAFAKKVVNFIIILSLLSILIMIVYVIEYGQFKMRSYLLSSHLLIVWIYLIKLIPDNNKADTNVSFHKISRHLKIIMLIGILSMPIYLIKWIY